MFRILLTLFHFSVSALSAHNHPVTILYDSSHSSYAPPILQSALLALSSETSSPPILIDLARTPPPSAAKWILGNGSRVAVSILEDQSASLSLLANHMSSSFKIFTPNSVDRTREYLSHVKVYSLQMSGRSLATALMHRAPLVGCDSILPALDNETLTADVEMYKIASPIPFKEPIVLDGLETGSNANISSRSCILLLSLNGSKGTLVLAKNVWERSGRSYGLQWFSPRLLHPGKSSQLFGLYSVLYVGHGDWDSPERRRLVRKLREFTGPNSILIPSAVLAYDAASMAVAVNEGVPIPTESSPSYPGKSGLIHFDFSGDRNGGVFFGVSSLANHTAGKSPLLQPSPWVLEDYITLKDGSVEDYHVATSAVFGKEELLTAGVTNEASNYSCTNKELEVRVNDPFDQSGHTYRFSPSSLPPHILIPNTYGFGLSFTCNISDGGNASLSIACIPYGSAHAQTVHCYRSDVRRARSLARDGGQPIYYMDSAPPMATTEAPPTAPPAPPSSKLPDLRGILKGAKPFVGACIGASAGCSVCVIVLGRLPLGPLPASCSGPCFTTTFANCGALLGRVFAETTVICTELFRQGLLDLDTFIADAEFGRYLQRTAPITLQGYQRMAGPLVNLMRENRVVGNAVAVVAKPWTKYMKYLIGHSDEWSWVGFIIHGLGMLLCSSAGFILQQEAGLRAGLIGLISLFGFVFSWQDKERRSRSNFVCL